jgi:hypothetical protein
MSQKVMYGGRSRVVHTGAKGGKYVVVNGGKKYINSRKKTGKKTVGKTATMTGKKSFFKGG